ncbi:Icc-related predicted phosphoesterase [Azospirillum brasilense]|uniref:Icc-related predicted phosphoesterase n=1 Tax=Azospirillum brasilense TaxID=192 RepID=A0A560BG10_AZOBR|nr:metallophosphoesterase [Azospirillum brasilense]TWA71548.1 Icc-related predicted phosphoesterase [Azospirillum brasilense]
MAEHTRAEGTIKVAAIGDIHVGETSTHPYRELFQEIADRADVLALAGDLTNHGKPREAEVLAEDLRAIGIPVVAVLGNHDHECGHVEELQRILEQAGVRFLDGNPVEIRGVGFAGVKGFGGGFENRMLDAFGEPAIKQFVQESLNEAMRLESALRQLETERTMVVLHYAPIAETVRGEPTEIYPFLGSSRLAETIDRFHVQAVVHGHAHHGSYAGRTLRGTPVYNVAQTIEKESGRPYALIEL